MEHGLFRVVTGIGAAFIEDQVVFLESEDRGHEGELWGWGYGESLGSGENARLHPPHLHFLVRPPHSGPG